MAQWLRVNDSGLRIHGERFTVHGYGQLWFMTNYGSWL